MHTGHPIHAAVMSRLNQAETEILVSELMRYMHMQTDVILGYAKDLVGEQRAKKIIREVLRVYCLEVCQLWTYRLPVPGQPRGQRIHRSSHLVRLKLISNPYRRINLARHAI